MNREILFRGKRVDGHGWVQGYIVEQNTPEYHAYIITDFCAEVDDRHVDILECDIHEVDPATIGQYTGLTDKNGKRIFEGDVVEYGGGKYKVVFVSNPHTYFGLDMIQEFGEIWPFSHSVHAGIMSVIGNIYDNPETVEV